jgi:ribosomal-protein-alanine N-acetyltransferase
MRMPTLETDRLLIRPFAIDDLDAVYQLFDVELREAELGSEGAKGPERRVQWLQWAVLNEQELASLFQPPYGDRAVCLKQTSQLIGACGFVPCLGPYGQLPGFDPGGDGASARLSIAEFGLFYAFSPAHQRQGYATEAARVMIDYAFTQLRLKRIIATTTYDNAASTAVMRKLGMRITRNPYPDPPWLQVVGVLENPVRA